MAFTKGNLITASGLNTINQNLYVEKYHSGGSTGGWKTWPSSAGIYCRNTSKQLYYDWYNGVFGGGEWKLEKLVNGSWVTQASGDYGWNTDKSGTITGKGEGWYRVRYEGNAEIRFRLYWAHYPNVKGSFLRYYNSYSSSGYTNNTVLTASILNSGRCGTIA